jgi:phenol 2-monooxygenase
LSFAAVDLLESALLYGLRKQASPFGSSRRWTARWRLDESFGLSEELLREAYHVNELTFWSMREQKLCRTGRAPDTPPGLSHLPHVILNQARINELLLQKMYSYNPNQHIDHAHDVNTVLIDLTQDYPVEVTANNCGRQKIFRAKYVLVSLDRL